MAEIAGVTREMLGILNREKDEKNIRDARDISSADLRFAIYGASGGTGATIDMSQSGRGLPRSKTLARDFKARGDGEAFQTE